MNQYPMWIYFKDGSSRVVGSLEDHSQYPEAGDSPAGPFGRRAVPIPTDAVPLADVTIAPAKPSAVRVRRSRAAPETP